MCDMEGWKEKKIGEVADFSKGKLTEQCEGVNPNWMPLLNADAINSESKFYANPKGAVVCDENDILMLWDGERSGLVAIGKAGVVGSTFSKITLKNELDSRFCFYYLQNQFAWIQNRRTGTGVPHVSKDLPSILSISFPTLLSEQQKIATILSTIDQTIDQTEQLIAKYKNIKQGLMHDLLTYGIDENGTIRNPQTHTFVEKKGLVVPEEWEVEQLDEIANVSGGKRLPAGHEYSFVNFGFKYLRVTDFYNKKIDYFSLENLEERTFLELENYEIFPNDLFISIAGSIGYVGVNKPNIEDRIILTENALRINVSEVVLPDFLTLQINSEVVQKQIWSEVGTGGGVPKLAKHRVESLLIPFPKSNGNYNEQDKIISIIEQQDKIIESEQTNLTKLQKLKQGLMADLLTGKVRVKIDIPTKN
ncbi:MAG: restriction endonuclease subunit S [Bacteroidia bacterium]|nr:restriction endonuclease subunit S [Bacteroidia bacterium]